MTDASDTFDRKVSQDDREGTLWIRYPEAMHPPDIEELQRFCRDHFDHEVVLVPNEVRPMEREEVREYLEELYEVGE